ncbi:uncharacterized protein VTP21DRAFT_9954 [Calcarisporiella thermophila]|uniref:uncharacterized protein n=1 Tax=Calcarisporiella thermophila TaxID=911321 RepID=UPI00374450B7
MSSRGIFKNPESRFSYALDPLFPFHSPSSAKTARSMQQQCQLKLTHSFRESSAYAHVDVSELTYRGLVDAFRRVFEDFDESSCQLQWKDYDGDWVCLSPNEEGLDLLREHSKNSGHKLHVRCNASIREAVNRDTLSVPMSLDNLLKLYSCSIDETYDLDHAVVRLGTMDRVLLATKPGEPQLVTYTRETAQWLLETFSHLHVYVADVIINKPKFQREKLPKDIGSRLHMWSQYSFPQNIDLVIVLGGDGTVLFASWMLQDQIVPIIAFNLGSLGFLTIFDYDNHREVLRDIIEERKTRMNVRMRIHCSIFKLEDKLDQKQAVLDDIDNSLNGPGTSNGDAAGDAAGADQNFDHDCTPTAQFHVLNEVVIDRGASPSMLQFHICIDEILAASILADGLVLATPTGSTAYSLSAGGPVVHSGFSVIVTPIAPHSLTSRPMIVPGNKRIRVYVAESSRGSGWVSFDGRNRTSLQKGDWLEIRPSHYPVLTVSRDGPSQDWINSLNSQFHWNSRREQKL